MISITSNLTNNNYFDIIYPKYLIAIHFEAQKGKFSNLVFSKITSKNMVFTNFDQTTQMPLVLLHLEALSKYINTVFPHIRPAGTIFSKSFQLRVLLEWGHYSRACIIIRISYILTINPATLINCQNCAWHHKNQKSV